MNNFLSNLTATQRKLVLVIIAVVLYLGSTTATYTLFNSNATFTGLGDKQVSLPGSSGEMQEPDEPRTESCPLDGEMHTKTAKEAWEKRRPLAVMIENHLESRPQSGLSSADVVYEAVAEGGITRFMALFLCNYGEVQVGPVRSARTYFLDWASEYGKGGPLYAHVGGANTPGPANALGQIEDYDIKSLNQFGIGFPTYWRDYQRLGHPVATEHTMYSTTFKLWVAGEKRNWNATEAATFNRAGKKLTEGGERWDSTFVPWKFKDDQAGGTTTKITANFWESQKDYTVEWNYDGACNCYKRKNAGVDHTDLNNNKQLSPKNVVIHFMKESAANDGYEGNVHRLYANEGAGRALVFQDGKVIEGTWSKPNRLAREKFLDQSGQEISFNKGQIWIQAVPEGSTVSY